MNRLTAVTCSVVAFVLFQFVGASFLSAADCECGDGLTPALGCCGGDGQRPCVVESIFSDCERVCHSGNKLSPLGFCVEPAGPGANCGPHRPCADDHTCFPFIDEDGPDFRCFPRRETVTSARECRNLYVREFHESIFGAPTSSVFGLGVSAAAGVGTSFETGVLYGGDGRFGCYQTECDGLLTDIDINVYASQGLYFSYDDFAGPWTLLTQSAGEGLNLVGWEGFEGSNLCPDPGAVLGADLIAFGSALSAGVGLPVQVGCFDCTTTLITAVDTTVPPQAVCDFPEFCISGAVPPVCFELEFPELVDFIEDLPIGSLNLEAPAGVVCAASDSCLAGYDLDGGSYDPRGDPLEIVQSPRGPYTVLPFPPSPDRVIDEFFGGGALDVAGFVEYFNRIMVELKATNTKSGDSDTCSGFVAVADCSPPELIGCPEPTTLECEGPLGAFYGPTVNVSARDNCSEGVEVRGQPAPRWYPLGETPLVITAHNEWRDFFRQYLGAGAQFFTSSCVDICEFRDCTDAAARVSARNADGNRSVIEVVDTTAPDAGGSCPAARVVECQGNRSAQVSYSLGQAFDICENRSIAPVCDRPSGSNFGLGRSSVRCTATDRQGNADGCTFGVTVQDTQSPTVSCPASRTVECNGGDGTATVEYTVSAQDSCVGQVTPVCSHQGNRFSVGSTSVSCSAADESDNSASCGFDVTVRDTGTPVMTCPATTTVECQADRRATVSYTVGAEDACDGPLEPTCDHDGTSFPLGTTAVDCAVTDNQGNAGGCGFEVIVQDTTAPAIVCPSDLTVECSAPGGVPATELSSFLTGFSVTESCDPEPQTSNTAPDFLGLGTTPVIFSAGDGSGHVGTCGATVTVLDRSAPIVERVAASRTALWPPDHKMQTIDITISASDVCDPDVTASCRVIDVISNEPDAGLDDDDVPGDTEIAGATRVRVRAERGSGGTGRIYTIAVECADASGNASRDAVAVVVPHDMRSTGG